MANAEDAAAGVFLDDEPSLVPSGGAGSPSGDVLEDGGSGTASFVGSGGGGGGSGASSFADVASLKQTLLEDEKEREAERLANRTGLAGAIEKEMARATDSTGATDRKNAEDFEKANQAPSLVPKASPPKPPPSKGGPCAECAEPDAGKYFRPSGDLARRSWLCYDLQEDGTSSPTLQESAATALVRPRDGSGVGTWNSSRSSSRRR